MNNDDALREEITRLQTENEGLRRKLARKTEYIRSKVDCMLGIMGTLPLRPEELDDDTLVDLDPIGIVADSFAQVLSHLHETNAKLEIAYEQTAAIFDAAGIGIVVFDDRMRILSFNKQLKEYFFPLLDDDSVIGSQCRDRICSGNEPADGCLCLKVRESGATVGARNIQYHGRTYDIVFTPVRDQAGAITRCLGVFHDISHQKRGEEALRLSEERYRDLFEHANDLIQSVSPDGRFIYTNRSWRETLGYSEEEVSNLHIFDIIDPSCHSHCAELFTEVMSGRKLDHLEVTFVAKDGRRIVVEGSVNCNLEDGQPVATRSIFRDVTERKAAEEALATEKEQLAVTLRSIGDGVITTDTGGRIVLMNKIAEDLTGWRQEEACGEPLERILNIFNGKTGKARSNPAEEVLRTGRTVVKASHTVLIARDGSKRIIADSCAPISNRESSIIGMVLVFRDITEQEALKANLQRAEKLESLGILAGGIAHDFNNMLTGILGNISIAKMCATGDSRVRERLEEAEKAALRTRDLTQQLLTFAKGGAPVKKTSSIAEILTDLSNFALRGSNVGCCFDIPDDLWPGDIDPGQISQVIHNLVINADQAMPDGGMIHVNAQNKVVTGRDRLPLADGSYIHISIRDTGVGISAEHLPMIFDPYFTTKQRGSGLGLATSYSIVSHHMGCITAESEPGKGTTFHVYLPATPQETVAPPPQAAGHATGSGRILVMDDEPMIREVAGAFLGMLGYDVSFAEHGEEAIALYREALQSGRPFAAVVMDLTIPGGMGGKEAIRRLLEIDPSVKALVSSGYSTDPVMADYRNFGFKGVVLKPYVIGDLSSALQSVISES